MIIVEENIFYNYVYLDPRKPGNYNYGDLHFDFEPFYVGKGHSYRCNDHLNSAKKELNKEYKIKEKNRKKVNKIKKILKDGLEPIILKIYENLDEKTSLGNEIKLIKLIGRHNSKLGPLTNLNDGGNGGNTWDYLSENKKIEIRNKMSDYAKNKIGDKNGMFGKKHSKATINKMSLIKKGKEMDEIKGINHPNISEYSIQTPSNDIIIIIGRKLVKEFLNCKSDNFFRIGRYKKYKLIKTIKLNK